MTDGRFTSETGRKAGKASARVRRNLNTVRATEELGDLETYADAKRWLRQLVIWGVGRVIVGTTLNGCVQAVRTWKELGESEGSYEAIEALRADFKTLREERDSLARELELAKMGVR